MGGRGVELPRALLELALSRTERKRRYFEAMDDFRSNFSERKFIIWSPESRHSPEFGQEAVNVTDRTDLSSRLMSFSILASSMLFIVYAWLGHVRWQRIRWRCGRSQSSSLDATEMDSLYYRRQWSINYSRSVTPSFRIPASDGTPSSPEFAIKPCSILTSSDAQESSDEEPERALFKLYLRPKATRQRLRRAVSESQPPKARLALAMRPLRLTAHQPSIHRARETPLHLPTRPPPPPVPPLRLASLTSPATSPDTAGCSSVRAERLREERERIKGTAVDANRPKDAAEILRLRRASNRPPGLKRPPSIKDIFHSFKL